MIHIKGLFNVIIRIPLHSSPSYFGYFAVEIDRGVKLVISYLSPIELYFCNFSGAGSGKTLGALIGSLNINSKMTLIICPNHVVEHWKKNIEESITDSEIIIGNDIFSVIYESHKNKYLVLNWEKLQQKDSKAKVLKLVSQKIDFIILDEVHFVKKREHHQILRREILMGLINSVKNRFCQQNK